MKETRAEKNYISKEGFRRWVNAMHKQFTENGQAVTISIKGTTYVYLRSKVGVARCNPTDIFKPNIGIAYAWARCTGQPVYYEKEEKYTPEMNDWVYVEIKSSRIRIMLRYIAEGIDTYCFKEYNNRLTLISKKDIIKISPVD